MLKFAFRGILASAALAVSLPAQAQTSNWSGFYAGLNAGYAWGASDLSTGFVNNGAYVASVPNVTALVADGSPTLDSKGFSGGAQLGYNIQSGSLVYGIETDFNWMKANALRSTRYTAFAANPFTVTNQVDADWMFTLRPRIGFVSGAALIYATGGLAVAKLNQSHSFRDTIPVPAIFAANESTSDTKLGWTIGAGLEWALGGNWSVKGEYLYANFGSSDSTGTVINTVTGASVTSPATTISHSADLTVQTLRVGINYRF